MSLSKLCPHHLLILGNSNIGFKIAEEGIKRGCRVLITTRSLIPNTLSKHIEFIQTPPEMVKKPDFWKNLTIKHIPSSPHVTIVNTIGGSSSTPPHTVADINSHIPFAAIAGITKAFQENFQVHHFNVVQLSTLPAGRIAAPYPDGKNECDMKLRGMDFPHLTILKMGHVVEPFLSGQSTHFMKEQHRLVAEQMALLPVVPLIGDMSHREAVKIQTVDIRDIVRAVFNAASRSLEKNEILDIDAVSEEMLTQEEFFHFHSQLVGRKFRPIYLPVEAANLLVKHHSFGRFKSYVVKYCAIGGLPANHKLFEDLIGQKPLSLFQSYTQGHNQLVIPYPPLVDFTQKILKTLWEKPESREDTFKAVKIMLRSLWTNPHNLQGDFGNYQSGNEFKNLQKPFSTKIVSEKTYHKSVVETREKVS